MSLLKLPLIESKIQLKNRLVFPPMGTHSANDDGTVSDKTLLHYERITNSRCIGSVITEHCYVNPLGKAYNNQLSAASDDMIDGLSELAELIQNNDTKAIAQLNHAGSLTSEKVTGHRCVSASEILSPKSKELPRAMTVKEIKNTIEDFASAALRIKKAGFDGVELHAAHSYLLNQFYSPLTNNRKDEYGGGLDGRTRILVETVKAVRAEVGEDFPIFLRLGACDYMEGGTTLEDSLYTVKLVMDAGVDVIDITGGLCQFMVPSLLKKQGYFMELSKAIKENVSIPVISTGGITDPLVPDWYLKNGAADLIGVCRAINANPEWAAYALKSF